jgi:hypothetical protein
MYSVPCACVVTPRCWPDDERQYMMTSRGSKRRERVLNHNDFVKGDDVIVLQSLHDADLRVQLSLEPLVGTREPLHVHDLDRDELLLCDGACIQQRAGVSK